MLKIHKLFEFKAPQADYVVDLSADENTLNLLLEEKSTSNVWQASLTSTYIEEITLKTGNFKKYPTFIKMLISGFEGKSQSVVVDILSYSELELLRKSVSFKNTNRSSKKYIILTYTNEFERVHYPIPLNIQNSNEIHDLRQTIDQLREEIAILKASSNKENDLAVLYEQENKQLKEELSKLSQQFHNLPNYSTLIEQNKELKAALNREREESIAKIKKAKEENEQLEDELTQLRTRMDVILNQIESDHIERRDYDDLFKKYLESEKRNFTLEREKIELKDTIIQLKKKHSDTLANSSKLTTKISQLESEMKAILDVKAQETARESRRTLSTGIKDFLTPQKSFTRSFHYTPTSDAPAYESPTPSRKVTKKGSPLRMSNLTFEKRDSVRKSSKAKSPKSKEYKLDFSSVDERLSQIKQLIKSSKK